MTGFTLVRALGFTRTIRTGATGTACRSFATTMGQAKADKQNNKKKQWCDIACHVLIIALQSP